MEIHFHINLNRPRWTRNWSRRRKLIMSLALALVLFPTAFVVASDTFSDVPEGYLFHDAIKAIFGARITVGTTPTTYSPEDPVTRGQMAAFLSRGLGRTAYVKNPEVPMNLDGQTHDIALLQIETGGGATGGTGFLKVDAAYNVLPLAPNCPCFLEFYLQADNGPASNTNFVTIDNSVLGTGTGASTFAFPVPSGDLVQNVRLKARFLFHSGAGDPSINVISEVSAIWVPFGAAGGSTLNIP